MPEFQFSINYSGGDADMQRIDLYDASSSYFGFARTLAILGHYYSTGNIISKAPDSALKLYLETSEQGSFKQNIIAAATGAIIASPFTTFVAITLNHWIPKPNPQLEAVINELQEANRLKRKQLGLTETRTDTELEEEKVAREHVRKYDDKIQIIRSITSNSFKSTFRPVGRSVDRISITGNATETPIGVVDPQTLAKIDLDWKDKNDSTIIGVVNSFNRSSKVGIILLKDKTELNFLYASKKPLPAEDIFSWSQFSREPIKANGSYVRFFDKSIKRFLISDVDKCTEEEVNEYFDHKLIPVAT